MRQIKQFTDALERVLLGKNEGKLHEVRNLINQTLNELSGKFSKEFHELTLQETITLFESRNSFNADLAIIVAELLFEKGKLMESNQSRKCFMQALLLFQKSMKNSNVAFPLEDIEKLTQINNFLDYSDRQNVNQYL